MSLFGYRVMDSLVAFAFVYYMTHNTPHFRAAMLGTLPISVLVHSLVGQTTPLVKATLHSGWTPERAVMILLAAAGVLVRS